MPGPFPVWITTSLRLLLALLLSPGAVQAGSMLPFSRASYPDPVVNYTLCGRPAPSWVCDPGRYLTLEQGNALDNIMSELNDVKSPVTDRPTIMVAVVPSITLDNGTPTSRLDDLIGFSNYLQTVSWRKHTSHGQLLVALYRVANHSMAVQPGATVVSGECICQVYYESRQHFTINGFYTLLDILVRTFRDVMLGRQTCATSSDNVPWRINANGLCTWTTEIFITGVTPTMGSPEGGTMLVVTGHNLGMARGVRIGSQGCTVLHRNGSTIICNTHGTSTEVNVPVPVYLTLSGDVRYDTGKRYTYTQLILTTVRPLTTTVSGGHQLTVAGAHLDLVKSAVLKTILSSRQTQRRTTYYTNCTVESPTYMLCPTPKLDLESVRSIRKRRDLTDILTRITRHRTARAANEEGSVKVEDVEVECEILVNGYPMMPTGLERDSIRLITYEDPDLFPFEGEDRMVVFQSMWPKNDRFIDIKGSGLLPVLRDLRLEVLIGPMRCSGMELFSNQLTCSPPLSKPEMEEEYPPVQVKLGNLEFSIGYLKYIDDVWDYPPFKYAIIGGAGGLLIILIVTTVCCCLCRRKTTPKKNTKHKQQKKPRTEIRIPQRY